MTEPATVTAAAKGGANFLSHRWLRITHRQINCGETCHLIPKVLQKQGYDEKGCAKFYCRTCAAHGKKSLLENRWRKEGPVESNDFYCYRCRSWFEADKQTVEIKQHKKESWKFDVEILGCKEHKYETS